MLFKRNLHSVDRIARLLLGSVCVYIGFINETIIYNNIISIVLGLFGVINIVSAILSNCPVYDLAGFSTYHKRDDNNKSV